MKTNRINEIVTETLRKGGIEKFPTTAMDWLVQDIETKLEADAVKRIRKFMTPALIAKAISQSYSKRTVRGRMRPMHRKRRLPLRSIRHRRSFGKLS